MSTVIVVTWWGRDGIWAWVLQWIYFFIIYMSIFWIDFVTYWNTLSLSFNIYIDWIFWYENGV